MINLGFYTNENELIEVINPIISLLDGSNDFSTKEEEAAFNAYIDSQNNREQKGKKKTMDLTLTKNTTRYKNNANNFIIFAIKRKIIKILSRAVDIQNDIRLTKFLMEF